MTVVPELYFYRLFRDTIAYIRSGGAYPTVDAMVSDIMSDEPVTVKDEVQDLLTRGLDVYYHFSFDRPALPAYFVFFATEQETRFVGDTITPAESFLGPDRAISGWTSRMVVSCVAERPVEVAYLYHLAKMAVMMRRRELALIAQFGQALSGHDLGAIQLNSARMVYRRDLVLEVRYPQSPKLPGHTGDVTSVLTVPEVQSALGS